MKKDKASGSFTNLFEASAESISNLRKAVRLADSVIPFIVKTGQMTPIGADLRLAYYEKLSSGAAQRHERHELTVELRMFGGLLPTTPIGDLDPCPLGVQGVHVFAEACLLRIVQDGFCQCMLLWGLGAGCATYVEGHWETELLKAVGHNSQAA